MAEKKKFKRRDFLGITAGIMGTCLLGSDYLLPNSGLTPKKEIWPKNFNRELQRLLKEMETQSNRFWRVPKKDG
ncbi:MAG: hypothetical protein ACUVWV_00310 [Thermodesulfobacteriota bacterium]